jgi:hypothetical protein
LASRVKRLLCGLLGHDLIGSDVANDMDVKSCWCGAKWHAGTLLVRSRGLFVAPFGKRG